MQETYSLRHIYLGQPGTLAVAAHILDNGHSKIPQLIVHLTRQQAISHGEGSYWDMLTFQQIGMGVSL